MLAIVAVAAVGTGLSAAEPTGVAVFDVIERAAFGAAVTFFAACARRWVWLVLAGVATVLAGSVWVLVCGAVALGFAVHAAFRSDRRDRLTGALIGALSAQALLRTADVGFFGFTALVTGVVVLMVMVSGYRTMRRRGRRRVLFAVGLLGGFVIIAAGAFTFFAFRALEPLDDGIAAARRGMDQATRADQSGAGALWRSAEDSFAHAESDLAGPLTKLAYPVPVLSQHARLASSAATSGRTVTGRAARAATVAPYQQIRAADGTFDLDLISGMEEPVERMVDSMITARDDVDDSMNGWLVAPVRDKADDYADRLVRAVPQAEQVLGAIRTAPELLGGDGPRRYLLLFSNPAESRGLGGFIGAWAQLDAVDGKLELTRHGKMNDLHEASDPESRRITGEDEYVARYAHLQPARFLQNISASPDFPTVARVAEQLYPQAGGTEVDGVLYIDPFALAALLELTGPVSVEGIPEPLTHQNAAAFLMHDQYTDLPDVDERSDRLSDVAEATFDALTHRELPEISAITHVLSPMMHEHRLMAMVNQPEANAYLADIGLNGAFPSADGDDLVSIRLSNGSANKADYFLGQSYEYVVDRDPSTGATTGTVRGELVNIAPGEGEPEYVLGNRDTRAGRTDGEPFGSITLQISVYTALRPVAMRIDGNEVGIQVQKELGSWVATQAVRIDPGGRTTFELDTEGLLDPSRPYRLTLIPQPAAHAQNTGVTVLEAGVDTGRELTFDGSTTETVVVR